MSRFPKYAVAIVPAVEAAHTAEPYKSLCKAMAWCNAFNRGAVEQVAVLVPWESVDPVLRRLPSQRKGGAA